ncbi:AfsR/SARP family transcriptional regulator [Kutzneria chonburiensis]|uniref:BTAD domain-containing putative transcriptional regulator n=1 Tax=Kutzneria chonburiensis TaxID=1483604 RepID=A0ABV6MWY8_9PSEU|nr:BTAD domain-containing putative transcriptional regulator [Kutzneria chonburiensis]
MAAEFDFRVLGPMEVSHHGTPVTVGAARQRTLLAALLMRANQVVSLDELVRNVWEENPTAGARTTVQNYVMRLRNALRGASGTSPIVTASDGYLISVGPSELDIWRFRELVDQARAADPESASKLLTDALSLWRGDPLADVQSETLRREFAPRITEQLLSAAELHLDVELGLARHNAVIGELRDLTQRHPLRERFWAQLITALYRSGRQAEALQAFTDVRTALSDELGIDPGPELQELHRQVLTGDPALASAANNRQPLPRQLPQPVGGFVGRTAELEALDRLLDRRPGIAVVSAGGGFGKSSLVLRWAHDRADRFPDGQLFVNLRGFDPSGPATSPSTAVRGFLEAFGVTGASVPTDLEAQTALYRSLVADKRMLIVLDNAADSNQVTPLLPGTPGSVVVVTSRNQLSGVLITQRAMHMALDVLPDREAYELLTAQLGAQRVLAEPTAVADLVRLCAGLPLALNIVAARAATHQDFPLAALAAELSDARLDALDAGELSANLRAVFACSYQALGSPAAEIFGLLGLNTGPDISLPAAASLAGLSAQRARTLLREVENSHLVVEHAPGRYRMHDLVRLYAAERGLPGPVRRAAITRLLDFYLHTANAGELRLYEHAQPISLPPAEPGTQPLAFADQEAAKAWFDVEYANLVATMRNAVQQQRHHAVWGLAWSMSSYHWRRSRLTEDLAFWRAALKSTEAIGEHTGTANRFLGRALTRLGVSDEALVRLTQATSDEDPHERAQAFHTLAFYWERNGDDHAAVAAARQGLALFRQVGARASTSKALNAVGYYEARVGDFEQARLHCEQALELSSDLVPEVRYGLYDSLGFIAYSLGDTDAARGYYRQALTLIQEMGNIYEEPNVLVQLGVIARADDEPDQARQHWWQAVDLYRSQHRQNDVERVQRLLDALDGD